MTKLEKAIAQSIMATTAISAAWIEEVQAIADRHNVEIATGQMSDLWQVRKMGTKHWTSEFDVSRRRCERAALGELTQLDKQTRDFGVGPSNMERFTPSTKKVKHGKKM